MSPRRNWAERGLISALLIVSILAVYAPVVYFNFITYDDPSYITKNPHVRAGLAWASFKWAWTTGEVCNWHPITWLSHLLDVQMFGLRAGGHHFTNLIFHVANTLLLFEWLRRSTGARWRSLFVAALFGLHPLHVESVAWVAERKDVLSAFFFLLMLWAYGSYTRPSNPSGGMPASRRVHYLLALGWFALGLMSKPMLVTAPFVLLLLDYWPLQRIDFAGPTPAFIRIRELVVEKIPFFGLTLCSCVITYLAQREGGAVKSLSNLSLEARTGNALISYMRYLGKAFWPSDLAVPYSGASQWPIAWILCSLGALAGTGIVLWRWGRRFPYLVTGWLWFLGMLVPVIGLVQVGEQSMADRYTYLPLIGLFVILAWTGGEFVGTAVVRQVAAGLSAAAIGVACVLCAQSQLGYWWTSESLFRHALSIDRNNYQALNCLGYFYDLNAEVAQAERCYRAALSINPASTLALERLADILNTKGLSGEAAEAAQAVLQLDPRQSDAHCTLGLALMRLGKTREAIEQYQESIRIKPDFSAPHYNLANALARQGQYQLAQDHYREALRWDPDSFDAHNNLAYLLAQAGELNEAVLEFEAALSLKPQMWQAQYGLAEVLQRRSQAGEAANHYRQALNVRPDFPEALTRLAWLLASNQDPGIRNGTEAVTLAERACRLTGFKQAASLRALTVALGEEGRFSEAIEWAEKARDIEARTSQKAASPSSDELIELFRAGHPYRQAMRAQ